MTFKTGIRRRRLNTTIESMKRSALLASLRSVLLSRLVLMKRLVLPLKRRRLPMTL